MSQYVLVCGGGRDTNREAVFAYLDQMHAEEPVAVLIHGNDSGADTLAGEWAKANRVHESVYPHAAGPIRNQFMLDESLPDVVVAFPGGDGTADMVRRALHAGVPIRQVYVA